MVKHLGRRTRDGKATIYVVADEAQLNHLGQQLELDWVTLGNLRQLCNFDSRLKLGKDRSKKKKVDGWQLLEDIVFFQKDGSTILEPAIGSADYVYDTVPGLSSCMSETSVAQLMRPSGRKWTCGWRRLVQTPAAAWKLPHGASLRIEQFSGSTASYGSSASQVRRIQNTEGNLNPVLCTWLITVLRPFWAPLCGEAREGREGH